MSEINERIAALEAQLAELKASVAGDEPAETSSRRDVFKKLAIGATAVAAGGSLLAKATPAAAANGDPILMGVEAGQNVATLPTRLNYTGATTGLVVQSGTTYSASGSVHPSAIAGWASASGSQAVGVYGYAERGAAVGVVGRTEVVATGVGVSGISTGAESLGGRFQGGRAAINLASNGVADAALVAAVKAGDILRTNDGTLWFAPADGEVVPLGGAAAGNSLFLLDAPVRCYDSRATGAGGLLNAAGSPRTVALQKGSVGTTPNVDAVPAGATGALISLTLDATTGAGFIGAFAADITWPGNSNANWYTTGQILAVTTVSKVDADAQIKLQVGGGGSTQVIIDVIGYYA